MAVEYIFRRDGGQVFRMLAVDAKVVTLVTERPGRGRRTVQTLPNAAAAREHAETVAALRNKEGFQLVEKRDVGDDDARVFVKAPEGFDWDRDAGRVTLQIGDRDRISGGLLSSVTGLLRQARARDLRLVCDGRNLRSWLADALRSDPLAGVTTFVFAEPHGDPARASANRLDDASAVLEGMPDLRCAVLMGDVRLDALRHERLQALALASGPLRPEALRGLASSRLPALSTLLFQSTTAGGRHAASLQDLVACLRAPAMPALETVAIEVWDDVLVDLLAQVLAGSLPARLRELSVYARVADADEARLVDRLRGAVAALGGLERIGLPFDEISKEAEDSLRARLPRLQSSEGRFHTLWQALTGDGAT